MRRRLVARLVLGSLQRGWHRTALAVLAVTLSGTLVSMALSISASLGERTERILRAYGANIVVLPADRSLGGSGEGYLTLQTLNALTRLRSREAIQGVMPLLVTLARVGSAPIVLVGVDLAAARAVNAWWRLEPDVRALAGESWAVAGVNLAHALGLQVGDRLTARVGARHAALSVAAVLSTGGDEDDQLLVDLAVAQRLMGRPGLVSLVQLRAQSRSGDLTGAVQDIARVLPDARVQTVRQVALAEHRVFRRVQLLLGLIAAVIVLVAGIGVMAVMSALAVERRGEVALMKAIGAWEGTVSRLFFMEAGVIGLGGGLSGYALGWGLAQLVGRAMVAAPIQADGRVGLATMLIACTLAIVSSIVPVRRAMASEPATVLRGE